MRRFLEEEKDWPRIMAWIGEKVPLSHVVPCHGAFAVERDGEIIAAISLIDSNGPNVYIQARFEPHGLTKKLFCKAFDYAFNVMKVRRITSAIVGQNYKSAKVTEHFGFKLEGILRNFTPDGDHMYLSVLWPENCKYLEVRNG